MFQLSPNSIRIEGKQIMKSTINLDFNSITGQKEVDQARGLRLILAIVQNDVVQLAAVAEEVIRDERGSDLATWELVIGYAGTIGIDWMARTDQATVITGIQEALVRNDVEGVNRGR